MQHFFSSSFRRSIHRLTRRFRACVTGVVLAATLTTAAQAGITQLSGQTSQYAASNTITSFTVPAGGNRLLVVSTGDPNSKTNPSGVTFNGTAMSLGNSTSDNNISCDSIYYLKIPGTAAVTGDIVVTFSNTGKSYFISAVAFSGVDQTTPVDTNGPKISGSVNATGDSLAVTSQTGSLVFDQCDTWRSDAQASESPGASQTLITAAGGSITGGGFGRYLTSTQPGASSVTMSWTGNASYILHLTMNIHPAQIAWGAATNISGDTDVSTTGSLVGAFVMGNTGVGSTTVNGVTFQGFAFPAGTSSPVTSGNFTVGVAGIGYTNADISSSSAPFSGLSSAYKSLVGGHPLYGPPISVTMGGLTPGATYAFQVWVNDSFNANTGIMSVSDGAGSTVSLSVNVAALSGGLGQYSTGTFVASGTSQMVNINSSSLTKYLNAFQLRLTASPPTVTQNPSGTSTGAGQTATFTAAATGLPSPTVQWQVSTDGGSSFNNVAGATSTTLSFTALAG